MQFKVVAKGYMDASVIVKWNLWLISVLYFLLNIPLYSLIIALWCSSSAQNYLYDIPEAVTTQAASRRYPKTSFQAKNWNLWKYRHNSIICDFKGTISPFLSAVIRKFLHGQSHSSLGNRFNIFGRASRTTAKRNKVIWVVVESVFTFGNFCCKSFGKSGNKQHLHPWTFFLESRECKKKYFLWSEIVYLRRPTRQFLCDTNSRLWILLAGNRRFVPKLCCSTN